MARGSNARILIVDDDAELGSALSDALALAGYRCDLVLSGPAALEEVEQSPFDAIISDLRMDGMSGLELLEELTRQKPQLPVIVVTGFAGSSASDAMGRGAFHYFTRPLDLEQLQGVIERAIGGRVVHHEPSRAEPLADARGGELAVPGHAVDDVLLPTGPASRALLSRIDRLASVQGPVLIQGESGTGKELVARALHARGPRAHGPFVAVNMAAIPEQLLESELFGHVRGAFSGATQARRGLLLEAHQGTLLLDEIGDMPLELQAKLLRTIQFGEVRAVGSDRPQRVQVRFLAATHRDLRGLAAAGRFRTDLYFRLSVFELHVPPLRERRAEIPELVTHFMAQARARYPAARVRAIAPEALEALVAAPWVGNIRELASTVERLVVLGQGPVAAPADLALAGVVLATTAGGELPEAAHEPWLGGGSGDRAVRALGAGPAPLQRAQRESWTIDELTQHYVDWTMTRVAGDKVEAARILGINVSTLYRWLRRRAGA